MGADKHHEVNDLIREYLTLFEYKSTVLALEREATTKGIPLLPSNPSHHKSPQSHKIQVSVSVFWQMYDTSR